MSLISDTGMPRGHLRPVGAAVFGRYSRTHYLLLGLFILATVSAFNYWNLSSQYGDLVRKMGELQEALRKSTLKGDVAERHVKDVQRRLKDAEDELGKTKMLADTKSVKLAAALNRIKDGGEIQRLNSQLKDAHLNALKSKNASHDEIASLQSHLDSVILDYNMQREMNSVLQATIDSLRRELTNVKHHRFLPPPIRQIPGSKTADDISGELKIIPSDKVHIWNKGMAGITVHEGGPLIFMPPQA